MAFRIHKNLLQNLLEDNDLEIIILKPHNGQHSATGYKFENIRVVFENIKERNNSIDLMTHNSSPLYLYSDWLYYCNQSMCFEKSNFNNMLDLYFSSYERLYFRKGKNYYYIIATNGANYLKEIEAEVDDIIHNKLLNRR